MCTFFTQIPWEIEESALVDGCNRFQAFIKVIFPLAKPGISATTLYCFLMSWDEFMYANTFINTAIKKTVQVGGSYFKPDSGYCFLRICSGQSCWWSFRRCCKGIMIFFLTVVWNTG